MTALRRRRVLYLPGIRWGEQHEHHGGWLVLEGRGCVYNVVAGPFATREEAERAT